MATRRERLSEALLRHGAAEWGKYEWHVFWRFSQAGLLRGELSTAAQRERWAAAYLHQPYIRDRCRELAERLVAVESTETARKRQKRRRLKAELQKSQHESRGLSNRLAAEVSSKHAELQAAQREGAKCKEQCEALANRAAVAESTVAKIRQELLEAQTSQQLGLSLASRGGSASAALSNSSWFMVSRGTAKPHCFMTDAIFKTRGCGVDFFLMGRDLQKGSQVVAGDDATILEVAKRPEICEASEVVELKAGDAVLQVTSDHLVATGEPEAEESVYRAAGQLKVGDLVMLDSGEAAALTSVAVRRTDCQVLKIVFEPDLPVAVFSRPSCILSLGHKRKPPIRRGGRSSKVPRSADDSLDRASIPDTAGDYMD
eukprot:s4129_g2.t1